MYSLVPISSVKSLSRITLAISALGRRCLCLSITLAALAVPLTGQAQFANVGYGPGALDSVTTGSGNTAIGYSALTDNTTGDSNTASGDHALTSNTTGLDNTASGTAALANNTGGTANTASGFCALSYNDTGDNNTASGMYALLYNNGSNNTASGFQALHLNTIGGGNMADGYQALFLNKSGSFNTASGYEALYSNKTGWYNTAGGFRALYNTTGLNNIGLGSYSGYYLTTGNNNIDIGNSGVAGDDKKIRIGTKGTHTGTFIAGISGKTVPNGTGVFVKGNGQLGTVLSSARYKQAIQPMGRRSEDLLMLEPVTFRYKDELDPDGIPQFGLIAEEVEKVNPDLVVRDEDGKVNTVRYEAVNAMLLNEFLKEHRKIEEQGDTIAALRKQVEALTAGLQKVSRQLEMNKPVPQIAAQR